MPTAAINNPYVVYYISSTDPKQSLQVMIEEINKVKNQGFKEKELKDMKESYLTNHFLKLETNDSQTMSLGMSEIAGDWRRAETFMNEVEKTTVDDLKHLFSDRVEEGETVLLLIDVINDLEFVDGDLLLEHALPMAERRATLAAISR